MTQKLESAKGCAGRHRATRTFVRATVVALLGALFGGLLSALYSVREVATLMKPWGLNLVSLRPLHTTFAWAFVFLGGLAVVHRYLQDVGGEITQGDRWRLRVQVWMWAFAGLGIVTTLPMGITSGREYLGYHPLFSLPIVVGWLCFVWTFFRINAPGFWRRPIYVTMWGTGALFFLFTFAEQHAWLLGGVFDDPIVDKRLQWKACGTFVGTFNLFVYGSLAYVTEKLSGDETYGHSKTAYALFGVSLLNSFTNYVHHTYHLPQMEAIKWIAFVVSMLEIIILAKVAWDLVRAVRGRCAQSFSASHAFFASAKWWTVAMLFTSLLISVPPLNALVHGTYAITGHAMGTMIGMDTMILAGSICWILGEASSSRDQPDAAQRLNGPHMRRTLWLINLGTATMVAWLHVVGISDGLYRYMTPRALAYEPLRPEWLAESTAPLLALTGTATALGFMSLLLQWLPLAFGTDGPSWRFTLPAAARGHRSS